MGPGFIDSQSRPIAHRQCLEAPSPTSSEIDKDGYFSLKCHWYKHTKSNKSELRGWGELLLKEQSGTCVIKPPTLQQPARIPHCGDPSQRELGTGVTYNRGLIRQKLKRRLRPGIAHRIIDVFTAGHTIWFLSVSPKCSVKSKRLQILTNCFWGFIKC